MTLLDPQHVCTSCGYNIIGPAPQTCPFCGGAANQFLTDADCSARYAVDATAVAPGIERLSSVPRLGLEHTAYRVETADAAFMIDCPSSFDRNLPPVDVIAFTHKDFLGASNQYREHFGAEVWLHEKDTTHPLAQPFPFDRRFAGDFAERGIEAKHIGGHSPGFTVYLVGETLFPCDLVSYGGARKRLNPHGAGARAARDGARILQAWLEGRRITRVCDLRYVTDYEEWKACLDELIETGRPVNIGPKQKRNRATQLYLCAPCGYVYDPLLSLPQEGIAAGTPFAEIPDDWRCPDCNVTKADFVPLD